MNKKIIIISIVALLAIVFGIYQGFFRKEKPEFTLVEVLRGNVFEQISETGHIQKGEEINLDFKTAGRIEKIYVKVGDLVKTGEILVNLEATQLEIQLDEAKANVEAQKVRLIELQKGIRPEEIQISQTLLDKAKTELDNLYKNTPTVLNQAYNLADNVIRQQIAALFLYRAEATPPYYDLTYKYCDGQAANDSTFKRKTSEEKLNIWRTELRNLSADFKMLDTAFTKTESYLLFFQSFINRLNDTLIITPGCKLTHEEINKINTNKPVVNLALTNINTALTSVYGQRKAIESQKLIVQNHQEQLNLKLAGSTPEQIAYQKALLRQAEAKVSLLENQIQEVSLRSPTQGKITKINKRVGEMVQPMMAESVISLIPIIPFQIKVDIYEEDVIKMKIGNPVDISLVVFPGQIFKGKIISIDPTEKLIEGVVYYETTIGFTEEPPKELKPGMTADLVIKTAFRENVLFIPEDAIQEKNGKFMVQVFKDGQIEEREIEIGLTGNDNMIEVISELNEGELIIKNPQDF